MKLLLALSLLLTLAHSANAQCGPNGCYQQGYSTGFYPSGVYAESFYSAPVVVTESVAPVFTTTRTNGTYRAVNNMTGAVWTWNPYTQAWRYDGNRNQPVMIEQRAYTPSPYQSSPRCQCGCGCVNCRCGR